MGCSLHRASLKLADQMADHPLLPQQRAGFLGQRIGPVTAMEWHRNYPLLGVGGADSIVSIYDCSAGLGLPPVLQ
jgi:hypothetical protein